MDEKEKKTLKAWEDWVQKISIEDLAEEMLNNRYAQTVTPIPRTSGYIPMRSNGVHPAFQTTYTRTPVSERDSSGRLRPRFLNFLPY